MAEAGETKKSGCGTGAKIAGIGCLVVIIIGVIVAVNAKKLISFAGRKVVVSVVKSSGLPEDQQQGLIEQVDRVMEAYAAGELTTEQLGRIMEDIGDSSLLPMAMVTAGYGKYVAPSGLSDEEKARGRLDLQRFGRGVVEKKIGKDDIEELTDLITASDGDDKKLKDLLTDEEVRALLAMARKKADESQVPEEAFEVDLVAEFGRVIDEALQTQ